MSAPDWWRKPRRVSVLVDTPGWMTPYALELAEILRVLGDDARLIEDAGDIGADGVTFILNCHRILDAAALARSRRNLVAHASALPKGRGMSPWAWQVLDGAASVPVSLFEAVPELDAGPVYRVEHVALEGHELVDEIRELLGRRIVAMCLWYMGERLPPVGQPQSGEPSSYRRRSPEDSRLDPHRSLAEQMDLLRIVDNEHYPAFLDHRGHRYRLRIDKVGKTPGGR